MNKQIGILSIITLFLFNGCATNNTRAMVDGWQPGTMGLISAPKFEHARLDNNLKVFAVEDNGLPLIHFYAIIATGSIYDPKDKAGLAEIAFELMRTGGAGDKTGDEIDEFLDGIGAEIHTGAGKDAAFVSAVSHKDDFAQVLSLIRSMLANPQLAEDAFNIAKIKKRGEIRRRDDDIRSIADREFRRIIYGRENPYGRIIEQETVDNITIDDIERFHKLYLHPNNIVAGVAGDFQTQDIMNTFKRTFSCWPESPIKPLPCHTKDFRTEISEETIIKRGATQAIIVMGHLGISRDDPDYPACVVLSRILGTGWNSRFSRNIRQKHGLAYEAWASFIPEFRYPGIFIARVQTEFSQASDVVALMKHELEKVQEEIYEEEFEIAREGIINSYVFWFDAKKSFMERIVRYEYYGYPLNYAETLIKELRNVSKEDVLRVARDHLLLDSISVLIVGDIAQ